MDPRAVIQVLAKIAATAAEALQLQVERVIGRLVMDEELRRRFAEDAVCVLREVTEAGVELTACEL